MDRRGLLDFMRSCRYAVEATVTVGGAPQAAVVGIAVTDAFEVLFDALETSRKIQNLRVNRRTAFVIGTGGTGDERTVQFEGIAEEPRGAELDHVKQAYFFVFPDGPDRQAWPGITYVRVSPVWVRYSDYNVNPPMIAEFSAGDLAPVE
jgi:hypothetical protein